MYMQYKLHHVMSDTKPLCVCPYKLFVCDLLGRTFQCVSIRTKFHCASLHECFHRVSFYKRFHCFRFAATHNHPTMEMSQENTRLQHSQPRHLEMVLPSTANNTSSHATFEASKRCPRSQQPMIMVNVTCGARIDSMPVFCKDKLNPTGQPST